ncbi:hypothetical protein K493DRAFT_317646 [Basidiobolus meristosporus CBS 931.73]|uniref:Uncharacterized protein n=1 Tax=Basidiobolus meristosporus CBS 931.73 TaxID=1314790 RepID=A0A1Y1XYT2_9FUNG|nr:hypothetical protein K493DRAFT_317646 [Basidiobolus meristosporus CBS 931.73]|eukprot:ORX90917.1 hypothetical protein K493DRAFT_317646 [Basidiobolus meristosporus CBS 931.73]
MGYALPTMILPPISILSSLRATTISSYPAAVTKSFEGDRVEAIFTSGHPQNWCHKAPKAYTITFYYSTYMM